jgi:hypothetical protein
VKGGHFLFQVTAKVLMRAYDNGERASGMTTRLVHLVKFVRAGARGLSNEATGWPSKWHRVG